MSKITQRQAVEEATIAHFGDRFQETQDVKSFATKEDQKAIATVVAQGILEGRVEFSAEAQAKHGTNLESLTKSYVMGMVRNWFNKSLVLNGGAPYEAKNPGSRKGISDPEVKNLRAMLKQFANDPEASARIQLELDAKLAEIEAAKPTKTKSVKIDEDLVPDSLKDLLSAS